MRLLKQVCNECSSLFVLTRYSAGPFMFTGVCGLSKRHSTGLGLTGPGFSNRGFCRVKLLAEILLGKLKGFGSL